MVEHAAFWNGFEWWMLFPIAMMIFCILGMRKRPGGAAARCSSGRAAGASPFAPSDSARHILDKRYALGEITQEEYEERRMVLGRP
ncbi:MAG: SHOCT domain-containing protein [bacterium]